MIVSDRHAMAHRPAAGVRATTTSVRRATAHRDRAATKAAHVSIETGQQAAPAAGATDRHAATKAIRVALVDRAKDFPGRPAMALVRHAGAAIVRPAPKADPAAAASARVSSAAARARMAMRRAGRVTSRRAGTATARRAARVAPATGETGRRAPMAPEAARSGRATVGRARIRIVVRAAIPAAGPGAITRVDSVAARAMTHRGLPAAMKPASGHAGRATTIAGQLPSVPRRPGRSPPKCRQPNPSSQPLASAARVRRARRATPDVSASSRPHRAPSPGERRT